MDMILGCIAFAALVAGQLAAVIAINAESHGARVERKASRFDDRAKLIWEGGS